MKVTPITRITVTGNVEGTYDVSQMNLRILEQDTTGTRAKEKLIIPGKALDAVLEANKGTIRNLRSSITTTPVFGKKGRVERYDAMRTVYFETTDLEGIGDLMTTLVGIPSCTVENPTFRVMDLAALHGLALIEAKKKLDATFIQECGIFGKEPADYVVENWSVHYDESESNERHARRNGLLARAQVAMEGLGGGDAPDTSIESGRPRVSCTIAASYLLKGAESA